MSRHTLLKEALDRLSTTYGSAYLKTDPVQFPHRYRNKKDQELAGFLSAVFAYGHVPQILKNLERIFSLFPEQLHTSLREHDTAYWRKRCRGISYRFQQPEDLVLLLWLLRDILTRFGSIEESFRSFYPQGEHPKTLQRALSDWVRFLRSRIMDAPSWERLESERGIFHLLPDPESGSPCKRWNLFLRWMVRGPDGVDLGVWKSISTNELILPLDTHTARICSHLGLTARRSPSWVMAEEITESLRSLDPVDPVRYDFSISRLGILARCSKKAKKAQCRSCLLRAICLAATTP